MPPAPQAAQQLPGLASPPGVGGRAACLRDRPAPLWAAYVLLDPADDARHGQPSLHGGGMWCGVRLLYVRHLPCPAPPTQAAPLEQRPAVDDGRSHHPHGLACRRHTPPGRPCRRGGRYGPCPGPCHGVSWTAVGEGDGRDQGDQGRFALNDLATPLLSEWDELGIRPMFHLDDIAGRTEMSITHLLYTVEFGAVADGATIIVVARRTVRRHPRRADGHSNAGSFRPRAEPHPQRGGPGRLTTLPAFYAGE